VTDITASEPIKTALAKPSGARYFSCALQVNPYLYLSDNSKSDPWGSEQKYNLAIVEACKANGVEVIAVADHHRILDSRSLIDLAEKNEIAAFPGFEVETKDGIHLLCIFDRGTDLALVDSYLAECGVRQKGERKPCKYDVDELLDHVEQAGGLIVAPHIFSEKGLLKTLSGNARANAWKREKLVAAGISGSPATAPASFKKIISNEDPTYRRMRPMTYLNCNDVSDPQALANPQSTTLVKMSEPSLAGLKQAFLDPGSRLRLNSQALPEERMELVAIAFEGGFLSGLAIHFNDGLNVLVGGRGTGKSTIIESIRYALGVRALGTEAQDNHAKIIRSVVGSGSKVSLLVETRRPDKRRFLIERTAPNASTVRDENGEILSVTPAELLNGIEIFGQHEISEVTRQAPALTELLARFADSDTTLQAERERIRRALEETRGSTVRNLREIQRLSDKLAALPALQDTLKMYQKAGIEEKLKEQSLLLKEERAFATFEQRVASVDGVLQAIDGVAPIDTDFISDASLKKLPAKELLAKLRPIAETLSEGLQRVRSSVVGEMKKAQSEGQSIRDEWSQRKVQVEKEYQKILRELQKDKVDGEEFMRLRRQIEELEPKSAQLKSSLEAQEKVVRDRAKSLSEWEDLRGREFRLLDAAAKKVNDRLGGRLRISVTYAADQEPLLEHLRKLGFKTPATPTRKDGAPFSLQDFAGTVRRGADAVNGEYRYTSAQAEKIGNADLDWKLQLEELDLPATTQIELNVGTGTYSDWRRLEDLSTGQKATAVLLLLLIDSEAPLVVDQPEDDLDNRFIFDTIVPMIREAKGTRQFIFATHNANVPILGDAELIAGLTAVGEASGRGHAELNDLLVGSIDKPEVASFAEDVLEGGKAAFVMRKDKYGF